VHLREVILENRGWTETAQDHVKWREGFRVSGAEPTVPIATELVP